MAGHSKWAKVKHFKGAIDAKRGKIFAKLGKEISIAAKIGGPDPNMNPRLRMALLKSRAANMPNDNVERAIKRGAGGGETGNYDDLTYEAFGPHGSHKVIELTVARTDTTNLERGYTGQRGQDEQNRRARKAAVQTPGKGLTMQQMTLSTGGIH